MADEGKLRPLRTIKLSNPIEDEEGNLITEIKFKRRPVGGDWIGFPVTNPSMVDFLRVASRITGIQLPFLKKLETADVAEIAEELAGFFEKG